MPYSNWEDVNASIKGIKPKVSLSQANWIASLADEIGGDAGWPTAIKQFKKTHTVRNRRWVKRRDKMSKKSEELETPAQTPEETQVKSEESYGVGFATSFAQLRKMRAAEDMAEDVRSLTADFVDMLWNIMYSMESKTTASVQNLTNEYIIELEQKMQIEPGESNKMGEAKLTETFAGPVAFEDLQEAEGSTLAYLDVQIIKPGWGNRRDNHFYPAEMLKRDAKNFLGAKMYETDHNPSEKSTRTWVSTVKEIIGFTDDGAPIARVAVHDPNFAERVRNLNSAKLLDKMECSIMAAGVARKGFELDGRKGSVVESIDEVSSVDWVTRAGAGGKVLGLAESEADSTEDQDVEKLPAIELVADNEVNINEQQNVEDSVQADPEPLTAEEVRNFLAASKLPEISRQRLSERQFMEESELKEAITTELEYVKELTGSGRPFGLTESAQAPKPTLEEINRRKDEVNKKYLGGQNA